MSARGLGAALRGAVFLAATVGCYDTHLRSCAVACGPQNLCPAGFVCQAGVCASAGEVCRGASDGGDADTVAHADTVADADAGAVADALLDADAPPDFDAEAEPGPVSDASDAETDVQTSDSGPDAWNLADVADVGRGVDGRVPVADGWWAMQPGMRANSTSPQGPAAYARSDGNSAIVYGDADDHVRELLFNGDKWQVGDLTTTADLPKTASPISVFVQVDGTNTLTYRTANDNIEIFSQEFGSGAWLPGDVCRGSTDGPMVVTDGSAPNASPVAAGSAQGYVRADQTSAIVFRDVAGRVYELARRGGARCWSLSNLQDATGSPPAAGDPMGFVRADRTSSVIYVSADGHVQELSLAFGASSWKVNDLMASFPAGQEPPGVAGQPRGYVRNDGSTAIVYRANSGEVWELSRIYGTRPTSTSWFAGEPAPDGPLAVSDPAPYVRADGQSTIVYRAADDRVWEVGKPAGWPYWLPANYLSIPGAPAAVEGPAGYVRGDGTTAVVYHDAQGHVWQLELSGTPPNWSVADLSAASVAP